MTALKLSVTFGEAWPIEVDISEIPTDRNIRVLATFIENYSEDCQDYLSLFICYYLAVISKVTTSE